MKMKTNQPLPKIQANNFVFDPKAYLDNATTLDDFAEAWRAADLVDNALKWYRGDIAVKVVDKFQEAGLAELAELLSVNYSTLNEYRRVARAYPPDKRNFNQSWSNYLIASRSDSYDTNQNQFKTEERYDWLEQAEVNNWNTRRLAAEISTKTKIDNGEEDYSSVYHGYIEKFSNSVRGWDYNHLNDKDLDTAISSLESLIRALRNKKNTLEGKINS